MKTPTRPTTASSSLRTTLLTVALLVAAGTPAIAQTVGPVTVDANNTLSADRPILTCPVQQTAVKNGARPDPELLKKIVRCQKGEKAAAKGMDGAVTIDVTALQIGEPRKWTYAQDQGSGKSGTTVYPVKATYTERTFYRSSTDISANWIRILNFYVDAFGEWQIGSQESVKSGDRSSIPRAR